MVPGGYASVPAGYDKIVEVMLKLLEVVVLFQAVREPVKNVLADFVR